MTPEPSDWLTTRRPSPPPDLLERIRHVVEGADEAEPSPPGDEPVTVGEASGDPGASVARRLVRVARERLDAARARPGRVRDSAFELLVADALVTYACEAALEAGEADEALRAIAEVGSR